MKHCVFDEGYTRRSGCGLGAHFPVQRQYRAAGIQMAPDPNNDKYMWGGWAGVPEMFNPAWFDYNDHFTHAISRFLVI